MVENFLTSPWTSLITEKDFDSLIRLFLTLYTLSLAMILEIFSYIFSTMFIMSLLPSIFYLVNSFIKDFKLKI